MGRKLFRGTKDPLAPDFDGVLDMTPARFDILHVIHSWHRRTNYQLKPMQMLMSQVRKQLALHPATIAVAVRRLAQLGLVTVARDEFDRRQVAVTLTREGIARIRRAYHLVFTGRSISRCYRAFISQTVSPKVKNRPLAIDDQIDDFWFYSLVLLGQHIGDKSDEVYRFRWQSD